MVQFGSRDVAEAEMPAASVVEPWKTAFALEVSEHTIQLCYATRPLITYAGQPSTIIVTLPETSEQQGRLQRWLIITLPIQIPTSHNANNNDLIVSIRPLGHPLLSKRR